MKRRRDTMRTVAERGSAATTLVVALPVMIGIMGLAVDLGYVYTRQAELQQMADSLAMAAAGKLNGTKLGVKDALKAADDQTRFMTYNFGRGLVYWNAEALQLAATSDAAASDWTDASAIASDAAAAGLRYAKVDASKLGGDTGSLSSIETFFISVLGYNGDVPTKATAVAGPAAVAVTPLAICALDPNKPADSRPNATAAGNERTEYGFRVGVSYNLLDLSPNSTTPQAYLVNPFDPGSGPSNPIHFGADYVKQFFCTGSVRLSLVGANTTVHVTPLPGLPLQDWLNSRFNAYPSGNECNRNNAPPDRDIREYIGGYTNWYMSTSPYPSTSASTNRNVPANPARVSVADLKAGDTSSVTPVVTSFGPLWAASRPVTTSGAEFAVTDWNKLYTFGGVSVPNTTTSKYGSAGVPYQSTAHRLYVANGIVNRRFLNIPLLDCSAGAPASPASVLAIGKFFMTAKATAAPAAVPGEFGGILTNLPATTAVALYK